MLLRKSSDSTMQDSNDSADPYRRVRQSETLPASLKSEKPLLSGYMMKQGAKGPLKLWRNRWFIFDDRRCLLFYYRSPQDFVPLGSINISKASFAYDVETLDKGQFRICVEGRDYQLQAQSKSSMDFWLKELSERRRDFSRRRLRNPADATRKHERQIAQGGLTGSTKTSLSPEEFGVDWSFLNEPITPAIGSGSKTSTVQKSSELSKVQPDSAEDVAAGKKKTLLSSFSIDSIWKRKPMRKPSETELVVIESKDDSSSKTGQETSQSTTLINLQDDNEAMEREILAKNEVIKKLRKQLSDVEIEKFASEQFIASETEQERLRLLVKRDHKIVQVEMEKQVLEEQKIEAEHNAMEVKRKLDDTQEQISMFQEMLAAKDEVVMNLTNQIFELEQKKGGASREGGETSRAALAERQQLVADLQSIKDTCECYKMQNSFLNSEVLELSRLREDDEETRTAIADKLLRVESELCKVKSQNLLLLEEINKPKRGGGGHEDEGLSQEQISRLLEDAMSSDLNFGDENNEGQDEGVDQYGFRRTVQGDKRDAIPSVVQHLREQSQQLEDTDTGHLVRWENYLLQRGKRELERTNELKQLIRGGIPHEHRSEVWVQCINFYTQDVKRKGYYAKLVKQKHAAGSAVFFKQIELDLLRTMPNNKHYDNPHAAGIQKLRNVLRAYSCHNPSVGYCQGINRLAAVALLYMDEEDAFWCLVAIIDREKLLPRDYYNQSLLASQVDQRVFRDILGEKLPRLSSHFEAHGIDLSLITFNWFLTIFVDNTPIETSLRIWDSFLYEGSKILFRFALALFKMNEEALLACDSSPSLFNETRNLALKTIDLRKLSHTAFVEMNPFPMKNILSKRTTHMATVTAELTELENVRLRHKTEKSAARSPLKSVGSDDECQ